MAKASRLGTSNPLTAVNPLTAALAEGQAGPSRRTTFSLSLDVADLARDAAHELRLTVVDLVETAIREHVARLEEQRGEPFTPRPRPRSRRRRGRTSSRRHL